jgi:hypothetical protein
MAEQEDLEQQLNNVSDDDGSDELSVNRPREFLRHFVFIYLDDKNVELFHVITR